MAQAVRWGEVRAPEIDRPGIAWLNVAAPLPLEALRGRLVILDFWTFCCINCLQIIPTLKRVEARFPDTVAVIGIHSPKFQAEKDIANVREAVARYGIEHPVAHDPEFQIWRQYGVRAWPTMVFIGPDGSVIGQTSGEPDPQRFEDAVAELVQEGLRNGSLVAAAPLLAAPRAAPTRLSFPGKIKPLPGTPKRWIVADGGHHQVVVFDDAGRELERYGSGAAGFEDGSPAKAAFNSPQGLIASAEAIYVADTFNHAIRRIDRATGGVTTLAGRATRGPALRGPQPGREAALASPWDLELLDGGRLAFCNAGSHQLGVLDLADSTVRPLAGNGGESIVDGLALQAQLAQPSGLARDAEGRTLYFADSETSAIRALDLGAVPSVRTVVGTGLFDFGHVNGPAATARLQHALGLAWLPGRIVVADSYNAALRVIDLAAGTVADIEDPPFLCEDALCLPYGEPAGVAADGPGRLLLSDTNNHRIVELRVPERRTRTWSQA